MKDEILFYVWYATQKQNDKGEHHKMSFMILEDAQKQAELLWEKFDFVSIDKVSICYDIADNKIETIKDTYSQLKDGRWVIVHFQK